MPGGRMPRKSFAWGDEARRALLAITSDPAYGAEVLSDPQTLANLLHDMLPDSPREAGVLAARRRWTWRAGSGTRCRRA